MNCPFCALLEGEMTDREIVGENATAVAWLHESRAHRGHAVIVSRRHVENLSDLTDTDALGFLEMARATERATLFASENDRAILVKLGLQVPHLHLHIYPFPRGATRAEVMQVIDGRKTDDSTEKEKGEFADRVREHVRLEGKE